MKKMKKRRELDALVNGKLGRRKKGQHELLRNESDSSEVDEFSIPEKTIMREGNSCSFCATCTTVCGIFMLFACMAAIAGLIWVHIELKKEVDVLRSQLGQVQITAPQSLQQVVKKQQMLESNLHKLQDVSLAKLQQNISHLFSQISVLNASVTSVMKQSSSDAVQQPENKELMQSIATLGSTQHSLQAEVAKLAPLPDIVSSQADKIQMIDYLLDEINNTVKTNVNRVNYLLNKTDSLELRFGLLDVKPGMTLPPNTDSTIQDSIHNSLKEFLKNISLPRNVAGDISRLENTVNNIQGEVNTINMSLSSDIIQVSKDLMLTTVRLDDRITNLVRNLSSFRNISAAVVKELNDSISVLSRRVDQVTSTRPVTQPKSESLTKIILSSIRPSAMTPVPTQAPLENGYAQTIMPTPEPPEKGSAQTIMPTPEPPENGNAQMIMPTPEPPESGNAQMIMPVQEPLENGGAQKGIMTTKNEPVAYITIPGINSFKDVDDRFDPNQNLSYDELQALSPTPYLTREIFDQFDKDKDGALSRNELLSALGITETYNTEYN